MVCSASRLCTCVLAKRSVHLDAGDAQLSRHVFMSHRIIPLYRHVQWQMQMSQSHFENIVQIVSATAQTRGLLKITSSTWTPSATFVQEATASFPAAMYSLR